MISSLQVFRPKLCTYFSSLPCVLHALPCHHPWFDHPNSIWWSVGVTNLQPPTFLLGPNISLSALFPNTLNLRLHLVRETKFHTHTEQSKKSPSRQTFPTNWVSVYSDKDYELISWRQWSTLTDVEVQNVTKFDNQKVQQLKSTLPLRTIVVAFEALKKKKKKSFRVWATLTKCHCRIYEQSVIRFHTAN
jgi:hypothetical protein